MTIEVFKAKLRKEYGPVKRKREYVSLEDNSVIMDQINALKKQRKFLLINTVFLLLFAFGSFLLNWKSMEDSSSDQIKSFMSLMFFVSGLASLIGYQMKKKRLAILSLLSLLGSDKALEKDSLKSLLIDRFYNKKTNVLAKHVFNSLSSNKEALSYISNEAFRSVLFIISALAYGLFQFRQSLVNGEMIPFIVGIGCFIIMIHYVNVNAKLRSNKQLIQLIQDIDDVDFGPSGLVKTA